MMRCIFSHSDITQCESEYPVQDRHYVIYRNLKTVARIIGLKMPMTTFVVRHSWDSISKSKGISVSVISESFVHYNEHTTQIYLASFDTSAVDMANEIILLTLSQSMNQKKAARHQ